MESMGLNSIMHAKHQRREKKLRSMTCVEVTFLKGTVQTTITCRRRLFNLFRDT